MLIKPCKRQMCEVVLFEGCKDSEWGNNTCDLIVLGLVIFKKGNVTWWTPPRSRHSAETIIPWIEPPVMQVIHNSCPHPLSSIEFDGEFSDYVLAKLSFHRNTDTFTIKPRQREEEMARWVPV